jgi:hypothetical protein
VLEANSKGSELARQEDLFGEPTLMELRNFHIGSLFFSGDLPNLIKTVKAHLAEAKDRGNVMDRADPMALLGAGYLLQGKVKEGKAAFAEVLSITSPEPLTLVRLRIEICALEQELLAAEPEAGLIKLEDLHRRWLRDGLFATSLEYTLFGLQHKRLLLLLARKNQRKFAYTKRLRRPTTLTPRITPASMKHDVFRLEAALAHYAGEHKRALTLLDKSLSFAELHQNRFGVALACAGRATVLRAMNLPGGDLDQARAQTLLEQLGATQCHWLFLEGWGALF